MAIHLVIHHEVLITKIERIRECMCIEQKKNWLGKRMEALTQPELMELIKEITDFKRTGLLEGGKMRTLEKEFSDNVSHTPGGDCMRLVENEILFEAARRFYNEKAEAMQLIMEESIDRQVEAYLADPNTHVFINHNNELGEWLYSVEVKDSDGFWLCSFQTTEEAEAYIQKNHLKKA